MHRLLLLLCIQLMARSSATVAVFGGHFAVRPIHAGLFCSPAHKSCADYIVQQLLSLQRATLARQGPVGDPTLSLWL